VPFTVDPSFHGEYSFFLHGIHHITPSEAFRAWNRENRICYFSADKNVSLFGHYSQDNCLLECRLKRAVSACGCAPWYLAPNLAAPVCGPGGNRCVRLRLARDRAADKGACEADCLTNCEMVHFFATGTRESYDEHQDLHPEFWLDEETGQGVLANYLRDPEHFFHDEVSKAILTLATNSNDFDEVARRRFREDISVLNFFFDTPIITQINLELRTNVFDQISAIGGTLGLFTGISVITFIEVLYWTGRFIFEACRRGR